MSDNDGQILDIAGGVALMFAEFILCFWYGFCRYPAGSGDFCTWLYPSGDQSRRRSSVVDDDIEDIRKVCSRYLHDDQADRFNPLIVWICFPVVFTEHFAACFTSSIAAASCCLSRDEETRSYGQHLSKSIAALIVVMGYYLLWMYGNVYCKLAGASALLLSQNLYNAILFEKSIFEFLQSFIFGDMMLLTLQELPRRTRMQSKSVQQIDEDEAKDRTFSMEEDDKIGDGIADPSQQFDIECGRVTEQHRTRSSIKVQEDTPPQEKNEEAAALAAAKIAALSETAIYSKQKLSTVRSRSKTRSESSFNPFTMLHSATFPKLRETASTPAILRDSDNDIDNVSLDLSSIEDGKIETFVEKVEDGNDEDSNEDGHNCGNNDNDDDDTSDSGALNAEEILADLEEGESSHSDEFYESNHMLSVYKATKRRLEEAFYSSTRIHVVGNANSDDSNDWNARQSNDCVGSLPSRVRTKDSYDFTFDKDEESDVRQEENVLPPILRVFDHDDDEFEGGDHDVEVDGNGQILGECPTAVPPSDTVVDSPKQSRRKSVKAMWNFGRRQDPFKVGNEKESAVGEKASTSPPLEHIFTNKLGHHPSFDEELTRNGTWDDSIVNETSQEDSKIRKTRKKPM